ncbi:ABC transporter permease [Alloscardovia venturai]|uniref:Transport permease protein n=1 Tax=Alloscardovia venturai TaxID=1769421 RepID=A0ABW2Y390_9BIFI
MKNILGNVREKYHYSFVVLRELVKTDFKLRYQGSLLGIAWSVVKPLMLFAVMYTVFVRFLKFTDGTPTFPVVLLLGNCLWAFFSEATSVGLRSIVDRGDLLRKIHFPTYIVVVSATIGALISLLINFVVVFIFCLFSPVTFTWRVILVPFYVIELVMLAVGVSLILAAMYVHFRDIAHIWEVLLQVLFYATPIIYPLSMVDRYSHTITKLMLMSPIAQVFQDIRHNFISPQYVPTVWTEIGNKGIAVIPLLLSVAIFVLGIYIFKKNSQKFAEVL